MLLPVRRLRSVAVSGALVAVLAALAPGLPAAAAGPTTWHVAPTGSGGGSCAAPDFTTIQAAVDASGPGDTILVCPGTYEGQVLISSADHNGLTIKATQKLGATIASGTGGGGFGQLVLISVAADVTIQDLRFLGTTGDGCRFTIRHVEVANGAHRARIIGNAMRTQGDATLQGGCTVSQGILVGQGSSATIQGNEIRDFVADGIAVGASDATIQGNTLRFWHKGWQHSSQVDPGTGILIQNATARIRGNTIVGLATAGVRAGDSPILADAILVSNADQAVSIRGNRVSRAVTGIEIAGGAGILVRGNDARGNRKRDCLDSTRGSGTRGTANTWIRNLGKPARSSPKGLCKLP